MYIYFIALLFSRNHTTLDHGRCIYVYMTALERSHEDAVGWVVIIVIRDLVQSGNDYDDDNDARYRE